ncbi:MAG: hypothetical protein KAG96_07495 [Ichthyobacteriaceae bacterium]|nr:hypothetical protein [Ichthyobacteriaceae bacterium]
MQTKSTLKMALALSKPISIFNNRYIVYPEGKVYSTSRKKFLSPTFNKTLNDYTFYLSISDNIPKLFFASSLIFNSFYPGEYDRKTHRIVRINGKKKDFRLENLKLLNKEQYFNFISNKVYKPGVYIYRGEEFLDIPNINFHKISANGKVLSFVKGNPHICKARKTASGADLISITIDYKKQKSIYPTSLAKKTFKEELEIA